jgi:hypothetical protein
MVTPDGHLVVAGPEPAGRRPPQKRPHSDTYTRTATGEIKWLLLLLCEQETCLVLPISEQTWPTCRAATASTHNRRLLSYRLPLHRATVGAPRAEYLGGGGLLPKCGERFVLKGARGGVVVKALCYEPKGNAFENRWGDVDWIDLAQDRDHWRALANAVTILWIP